jgi:hypothetical protein
MQWSMPHRVLQVVAGLIVLTALVAFTAGVVNAPERSRLPGEHANGAPGPLIQAAEATPLSQERIEGPPEPPPLTEEEKARIEAEKAAKAQAEAAAKLAAAATPAPPPVAPAIATPATPIPDRVGDLIQSITPPPIEEAPH